MSSFCITQSENESTPLPCPQHCLLFLAKSFSIFFSTKSSLLQLHLANCLFERSKCWMDCIQIKLIPAWKGNFPSLRRRTLIFHQKAHLEIIILLCFMEMSFTFCLFHLFRKEDLYKTPSLSKITGEGICRVNLSLLKIFLLSNISKIRYYQYLIFFFFRQTSSKINSVDSCFKSNIQLD